MKRLQTVPFFTAVVLLGFGLVGAFATEQPRMNCINVVSAETDTPCKGKEFEELRISELLTTGYPTDGIEPANGVTMPPKSFDCSLHARRNQKEVKNLKGRARGSIWGPDLNDEIVEYPFATRRFKTDSNGAAVFSLEAPAAFLEGIGADNQGAVPFFATVTVEFLNNKPLSDAQLVCSSLMLPDCGNGEPNAREECDDGNLVSGDGCSSVCQVEG